MTTKIQRGILSRPSFNTHFESAYHSNSLLNGLNELRCKEKLLDVTLIAEGEAFKAHRAVLASCSDYFRAMFTDAMKEAHQSEICLKGVSARGIGPLINYAYTSKLELNRSNVQDILSAANHIQMDAVVRACSCFLEKQVDLENCVDIVTIAEMFSLERLKQKTYRFICSELKEFSRTTEISRLTAQQFEFLLSCDYPVDCSEASVFEIVLQWIAAQQADMKIVQKLFRQIRFSEIKPEELERAIRKMHTFSKSFQAAIRLSVSQQMFAMKKENENCIVNRNILINSRGMELALIKIGGFGVDGITNLITYYLPSRKKWHNLSVIPHVEQCNYGTAVLGNDLYVVGGCYNVCLKEYIHPFGFRYCPIKNSWSTIAPMQQDRCRFSLNALNSCLYAVGGASEINENDDAWHQENQASNCERYDSVTDVWEYIPSIPENRTQHAGATHSCYLFICGGLDRHRVLSSFWRFDTNSGKWDELPQMPTPRADHIMLVINDKLYVCGGWYEEPHTENRRLVETIDVYDITLNSWFSETNIPTPKYHAGIVAVNEKIYVIGGLHSDTMFDRASSTIECYDIEAKVWTRPDRYPQSVWECTCVTLYVPRCREDTEVTVDDDGTDTDVTVDDPCANGVYPT